VLIGALAGELRFAVVRLGAVLGAVLLRGAAMAATDGAMARLGVSDPSDWDAAASASAPDPGAAQLPEGPWLRVSGKGSEASREAPGCRAASPSEGLWLLSTG
jgi:hypothetical protein